MLSLLILRGSQPRRCFIYPLFVTLRTYLPSSNISVRIQPARFEWVSSPESVIRQDVLSICFELGPLVQGSHHLGSNIPETEPFSILGLGSSMGYQASQLLSQGPQPFVYLFKEEAQCLYLGQNFPFLACLWTTCISAAIDKSAKLNHSLVTSGRGVVFALKRHCFFGRAVSVWTRRGCSYHTYSSCPKVLYLSAFDKR